MLPYSAKYMRLRILGDTSSILSGALIIAHIEDEQGRDKGISLWACDIAQSLFEAKGFTS